VKREHPRKGNSLEKGTPSVKMRRVWQLQCAPAGRHAESLAVAMRPRLTRCGEFGSCNAPPLDEVCLLNLLVMAVDDLTSAPTTTRHSRALRAFSPFFGMTTGGCSEIPLFNYSLAHSPEVCQSVRPPPGLPLPRPQHPRCAVVAEVSSFRDVLTASKKSGDRGAFLL